MMMETPGNESDSRLRSMHLNTASCVLVDAIPFYVRCMCASNVYERVKGKDKERQIENQWKCMLVYEYIYLWLCSFTFIAHSQIVHWAKRNGFNCTYNLRFFICIFDYFGRNELLPRLHIQNICINKPMCDIHTYILRA